MYSGMDLAPLQLPLPQFAIKEENQSHHDVFLSRDFGALNIDMKREPITLPSINSVLPEGLDNTRRSSLASFSSYSPSDSSFGSPTLPPVEMSSLQKRKFANRLKQIKGQLSHTPKTPYPTPMPSPIQISAILRRPSESKSRPRPRKLRSNKRTAKYETETPEERKKREDKAIREGNSRYDLSEQFGMMAAIMLQQNPSMAQDAVGATGKGWRPLRSNNTNDKMTFPLYFNKQDVMGSVIEGLCQDRILTQFAIEQLRASGNEEAALAMEQSLETVRTRNWTDPRAFLAASSKL